MKKANILMIGGVACLCGCAGGPVPMGRDTYMIQRGGWPHMDEYALEAKCLKDANNFCDNRGLVIIQTTFNGRDGRAFVNNASCELVFKAVPKGSTEVAGTNSVVRHE
ncbi:MAG: hypothetical protein WCS42_17145 [Verrucomicrobiota bacterium]